LIDLNKKFLIYGYGISGKSIDRYFNNKKCNYNIYDDFKKIKSKKVISKEYLFNNINDYSYFVVSPSIKIDKNHLLYRYKNKILIDLDFLSLEISEQKIIGVTGTDGKSSTCNYLKEILSNKYNTKIIGNFGNTLLDKKDLTNYLSKIDILIIELSSYQLDKVKFLKLHYALITNILSDHLEYHKNIKKYINSKFHIQNLLYINSKLYLPKNLFVKYQKLIKINKNRVFLYDDKIFFKNDLITYFQELNLNSIKKLIHDIDTNIKVKSSTISNKLIFRNQLIYNLNNLKIYNDSKCTNLNNAIYKINLINSKKKIIILGGKFKKQLKNSKFNVSNTLVLIFGYQANSFLDHLNFINSNYYKFANLDQLIIFLKLISKINKYNYILFSPGGESFDSYKNYIDRGKHFNKLIKKVSF
tara:strand:- start:1040 stop:2284 length:1245 start_codon:yes stop_codon:yes gene_type:complete